MGICKKKELKKGNFPEDQRLEIQFHDNAIRAKAVATKEGVWKGVFRPAELLKSNYRWLRGVPITINHPADGVYDSTIAAGQVIDAEWDDDQKRVIADCEMWPEKCPPEIVQKIVAGEPIEVSTGYFSFQDKIPGKWEDKEYSEVEKSLFFDHLAIVPVGACTAEDGCGFGAHVDSEIKLHEGNQKAINEEEKEGIMINIKLNGINDLEKISEDISKIEDPAEFKTKSTELLNLLGNQAKDRTGLFEPQKIETASYPKPKVIKAQDSDSLTLDFESSADIEETKKAIASLYSDSMKTIAEKDAMIKTIQEENTRLQEEKKTLEGSIRSDHIATIKAHSGDLTEEEAKVYEVMPIDQLKVVASGMAKMKVHSEKKEEKTKFMVPDGSGGKKLSVEQLDAEFDAALGFKR